MSVPDDRSLTTHLRAWVLAPLANQIAQMENRLMAREDENYTKLSVTVADVKTAFTSLQTENAQLRAALEAADADAVRRVDEALAADSEHDADKIAEFDASLRELAPNTPVEVPADGGPEVPADQAEPGVQG